jgi:hypothetical protein
MFADTLCHSDFKYQFYELIDSLDEEMPEFYDSLAKHG